MRAIILAVLIALSAGGARADETTLSAGVTAIGLAANDPAVELELSVSVDLYAEVPYGPGSLQVYVEGSSTPRDRGASLLVPESNADSGSALNRDGEGRLQVSELKYRFSSPRGRMLDVGLLDVTAYLDTTRVNNDENMQFLGASFLNNPTIEFPDYTLGFAYHREPPGRGPALSVVLTGSEGLADNPETSYDELFELAGEGEGVFAGVEAGWQSLRQRYRLGAWTNTADHAPLDGAPGTPANYGLYASVGRSGGNHAANVRLGAADRKVSPAEAFASLTYQYAKERVVLGLGAARQWSSDDLAGATESTTQLEAYLRIQAREKLFITPSVQSVRDSGFGTFAGGAVTVYALRLHHSY